METLNVNIQGIRPLLMHNGLLADVNYSFTKEIKDITKKSSKKMTDSDHERRNWFEWQGGLYWDDALGPIIPSENIERCIQLGAQKSRIGKDVAAAVFCSQSVYKLNYDGPRAKKAMYDDPRFSLRCGVGLQQKRIMRIRPQFPPGWSLSFELEFDDSIINEASIIKAIDDAGAYIGLGDWRPKFGRFVRAENLRA